MWHFSQHSHLKNIDCDISVSLSTFNYKCPMRPRIGGGGEMVVIQGFHLSGPFRGPLLPTAFFLHRSTDLQGNGLPGSQAAPGLWVVEEVIPHTAWRVSSQACLMGASPRRKSLGSQVRLPGEPGFSSEVEHVFLGTARGRWWGAGAQAGFLP